MLLNDTQEKVETEEKNSSKKLLELTQKFSYVSLCTAFRENKLRPTTLLSKVVHTRVLFLMLWTLHSSKQITSSQMDCAVFWKAFMLSSEKSHFKEGSHKGTHKSVSRREQHAKNGFEAPKLFILRTKEVGRFLLWGSTEFSCDSQSSFFPFRSTRMTPWKEQQWSLKPRKENIASSYSHS